MALSIMKSLISGKETKVLDLKRGGESSEQPKPASEASGAEASAKSSFVKSSGRKSLASLQGGGSTAKRAEFRAPSIFRS